MVRPAQGPPDGPPPERQDAERRERRAQHSVQKPRELPRWAEPQGARRERRVALEQLELERRGAAQQERQGVGPPVHPASPQV